MDSKDVVTHLGVIPESPCILCRDEAAAERLREYLHMDYARIPQIDVVDEWPDSWNVDAVVVTPLLVLGTTELSSFSISAKMSDRARRVLNKIIQWKRSHDGDNPSIREIGIALNLSRRQVAYATDELTRLGIITKKSGKGGIHTNIGTWTPDLTRAKAAGIEIKEYK